MRSIENIGSCIKSIVCSHILASRCCYPHIFFLFGPPHRFLQLVSKIITLDESRFAVQMFLLKIRPRPMGRNFRFMLRIASKESEGFRYCGRQALQSPSGSARFDHLFAMLFLIGSADGNDCCSAGQSGCTSGCFLGVGTCPGAYCSTCSNCNPGQWGDGCDCRQCPAGKYSGNGAAKCINCPAGSYAQSPGSVWCTPCSTCARDATTQIFCGAGYTYDATVCQCNAGFYGDGYTSCTRCTVCAYNAVFPGKCPAGSQSDTTCWCPAGYYGNAASLCIACDAGTWLEWTSNGDTSCGEVCPAGTWGTTTGSTSQDKACPNRCPAGSWGTTTGSNSQSRACPNTCPAGTWGTTTGSTSQSQACPNACLAGTWGISTGSTSKDGACTYSCAAGTYGASTGATSQDKACPYSCAAGSWGTVTGSSYLYDACPSYCPPGTWGTTTGATSQSQACPQSCPAGTWGSYYGASDQYGACASSCPAGTWGTAVGSTSQGQACPNACPAGTWGTAARATSQSAACPNYCPAGFWGNATRSRSLAAGCPYSCPPGTWGTSLSSTSQSQACPFVCPAGTFGGESLVGQGSQASACPNLCPAGTFGDTSLTGKFSQAAACPYVCPAGTYSDISLTGKITQASACPNVCRAGTYGISSGQISFSAACISCSPCPSNAYFLNGCYWYCSVGYAMSQDGVSCLSTTRACGKGFYNNLGICVACSNLPIHAYFTSDGGNSQYGCTWSCNSGFYASTSGCFACSSDQCPVGHYRGDCTIYADSGCLTCTGSPANSIFTSSGSPYTSNNCAWACIVGYYLAGTLCTGCTSDSCPIGQYRGPCSASSDSVCLPCTGNPANSHFTTAGSQPNMNSCVWGCNLGYFQSDSPVLFVQLVVHAQLANI